MKRAVIVTGLCRAGGSAIAEVCHVLGFMMGRSFTAPIAPDFRLDWEDFETTVAMACAVERGEDPGEALSPWLVPDRINHARAFGGGDLLGFKSPLFSIGRTRSALHAWLERSGFDVVTVRATRSPLSIERSIARQRGAEALRRWNEKIRASPTRHANLVLPYEALVRDPAYEVGRLAQALGIADPVAIARAAARVAKPCS